MLSIKISFYHFDTLNLCMQEKLHVFDICRFFKRVFLPPKKILSGILSVFNSFGIQKRPDLDPNCLQRLSGDDKSGH